MTKPPTSTPSVHSEDSDSEYQPITLNNLNYETLFTLLNTNPMNIYCDIDHFTYVVKRLVPKCTTLQISALFQKFDSNHDSKLDANEIGYGLIEQ
jgi:hypothetical protein